MLHTRMPFLALELAIFDDFLQIFLMVLLAHASLTDLGVAPDLLVLALLFIG